MAVLHMSMYSCRIVDSAAGVTCYLKRLDLLKHVLHYVSKNDPTLKRYSSKLYGSHDIWQIYSKVSRIDFKFFSFRLGLLVITLSSLKLHTENNVCMLCASIRC